MTDPYPAEEPSVDPDDPGPPEPAPPERRYPSTIGGAFYLAVLLGAAAAIAIAVLGDWRIGVRVLASALGAAAGLRLVLPERDAGMLAVRHRAIDVGVLTAVALTLWVLAGSIPDQPGQPGDPGQPQ